METQEYFAVEAKAVVMATGGCGRLHIQGFMTTNHHGATGDGIVMGYRAGAPVVFLHTVQYHPTGIVFPEQAEGILITEKLRGSGANLVNFDGEQLVNEREPRDVEAASIIKECVVENKGVPTPTGKLGIRLDSPMIEMLADEGTVQKESPGKYILYKRFGIDISKEPMLIYPTLHYQNGSLELQADGRTCLPGLFIAGKVGGGIHGANRLMGSSLLDIVVYGRISGASSAEYIAGEHTDGALHLDHARSYSSEIDGRVAPALIPDYTDPELWERQLTTSYVGNVR